MGNDCCSEQYQIQDKQNQAIYLNKLQSLQQQQNNKNLNQVQQELTSFGKINISDGSNYHGQILNGIPHGYGTQQHQNGQQYCGNFVKGVKQGEGSYKFINKSKYKGQFLNGNMNGKGKIQWQNGDWYQGQFQNNIINGFGKYYKKDKDGYYEGYYKNGLKDGEGTIRIGQSQIRGIWVMGRLKQSL